MRLAVVVAMLAISLAAVVVPSGAMARAGAARESVHQSSGACPIAGQCTLDPKTSCPTQGPLQPTAGQHCVRLGSRVFFVKAVANNRCVTEVLVRVRVPAGLTEYEAVVYSTVGSGTRWWSTPDKNGNGAGWGPGQVVSAYGAVNYTVPAGFHAWQVGGGSSPAPCNPGKDWVGKGAWAIITPATGGSGALTIHGPTNNGYHVHFIETVSGTASGGANYVISGEQLDPTGGCAPTVAAESAKGPLDWMQWPTGNGPVHGHFSLVAKFYSANYGRHGMCAYLVNRTTNEVYARASQWWTNAEVAHPVPGSGTIGIQGPTKNALGTKFNETVSGMASGGANYVMSGEQFDQGTGCAASFLEEVSSFRWRRWPTGTGSVHGHFSLIARFGAANAGTHGICSYLINATTQQTYAHASLWWTNS
jgi:hypothetical protein